VSNKKTQAQNAMKPAPAAKADEAADPVTKTSAAGDADVSSAKQGTEAENPPGPDERAAETGTKQNAGKAKKAAESDEAAVEQDPAEKEAEDYDLDDPKQAAALMEEVINGLVSFGPAVTGALSRKPKVEESWNKLVRKARKIQNKINKINQQKDKARK